MRKLIYFSVILLLSCTAQKQQAVPINDEIGVTVEASATGHSVHFTVQNKSAGPVFIHNHRQLHIEQLNGAEWVKLRVLSCPCGAPCAKPSEFIEISPEGVFELSWDRAESWCGEKNPYGIPETVRAEAPSGRYRVMVVFSTNGTNTGVFYKEFDI